MLISSGSPEYESFGESQWTLIPQNPTGHWVSSTKFVEKSGSFEQVDETNWVEHQANGDLYFVRVSDPADIDE